MACLWASEGRDVKQCDCWHRAHRLWAQALQRLGRKPDARGEYEALSQQHSTVQMSDMDGMPARRSTTDVPEQTGHEETQVCNFNKQQFTQYCIELA